MRAANEAVPSSDGPVADRLLEKRGRKVVATVFDYIDRYGFNVSAFANALAAAGEVEEIIVRINSPGGSAFDGVAMYNTLVNHKAPVRVEVHGLAGSAASVIAMAGDQILMGAASRIFIHEPAVLAFGPARALQKIAAMLESHNDDFIDLYAQRATKLKRDKIAEMLRAETEISAKDAIAMGFATGYLTPANQVKAETPSPAVDSRRIASVDDINKALSERGASVFRKRDASRPELSSLRAVSDRLEARRRSLRA